MPHTYSYILDEGGGNGASLQSMAANDPEEDDDICPVCESECTCANRPRNSPQSAAPLHSSEYASGYAPPAPAIARTADGYAPTQSSGHSSLKIKLTLPPRPLASSAGGSSKHVSGRASSSKKKSKSVAETTFTGGSVGGDAPLIGSPFSDSSQHFASGGGHGAQLNADGSIPKKRGRPTKAVVAAREAAKVTSGARVADCTNPSIVNVGVARHAKQSAVRKAAQPKSANSKKKGKKLHGAAAASRAAAQQRRAQQQGQHLKKRKSTVEDDDESSDLSDLNGDDDEDGLHSIELPTFMPAFSSSSNSSSSDSDTDSDSDQEEKFPSSQDASSLLMGDNEHAQRKGNHHNNWEIRSRKRSVEPDESSAADMDADSDEEETEEEEGEEDEGDADEPDEDENGPGVPRLMRYAGVATGWTDDEEESSFDADIFFANLSDSTADGSDDDDQMGDVEEGFGEEDSRDGDGMDTMEGGVSGSGMDMMRLSEVAAAGFLAPFADLERSGVENTPFVHGWDHLLLSNSLKDSILDFDIAQASRNPPLGSGFELTIPGLEDADAMMATSEEEEAVAMFDNDTFSQDQEEEDGVEIFEDSDGGDTTEDEFVDVDGIATPRNMVLLHFPASLGAIDPMSTVSIPTKHSHGRGRMLSSFSGNRESSRPTPKPADILSGKVLVQNKENIDTSPDTEMSNEPSHAPAMGSFAPQIADKTKRVVIASSGNTASGGPIPSPFPAIRRLRRRADSLSKVNRSASDHGSSRPSSFLSATRSPFEPMGSGDFDSTDDTDLPSEPIKLDDVLDAAFLEPEPSDAPVPDTPASETGESDSERDRHLENLRRWDRIPIDAFRKTRVAGGTDLALVEKMGVTSPVLRAPRPADGFSYGSAVGGMLRGNPLNPAFWESDCEATKSVGRKAAGRGPRPGRMSVIVSPVILPARDGDRTPTNERDRHQMHHAPHQQHSYLGFAGQRAAQAHAQNIKSRKELRKEKKRNRKFFGSTSSHIRHNHFPNMKGRSSGSMQRSNFSSSSIPSLSI
ncbi:hypothetical protein DFH11DRAFT_1208673 [Phellopilus nigrolimitatus]|nr:hypothetical protein DFH11DRAFT_1208673 [Phellopilus nigrolimitatus]